MRFLILLLVTSTYFLGCTNIIDPEPDTFTNIGLALIKNNHEVDTNLIDQLYLDMAECSGFNPNDYVDNLVILIDDDLPDNIAGKYIFHGAHTPTLYSSKTRSYYRITSRARSLYYPPNKFKPCINGFTRFLFINKKLWRYRKMVL